MALLLPLRRLILGVTVTCLIAAQSSRGSDEAMLALFKILRDRGSISDVEYQQLVVLSAKEKEEEQSAAVASSPPPASEPAVAAVSQSELDELGIQLAESEARLAKIEENMKSYEKDSDSILATALNGKWYEGMKLGGYTQFRFNTLLNDEASLLEVPADRSVSEDENFFIRRARIKFTGDVADHLYLYSQIDLAGSVGGGLGVQARDIYADISLDDAKEFRIRAGISKVPFSWVNMQSSQNRAPTERPDGLNTANEGERDYGLYFMYAPEEIRKRFKTLVKDGHKGSGDYGMFAIGAFNGQGLNRPDLNGEPHVIARLTYPWLFPNGQFFEAGIAAYTGRFVTRTSSAGGSVPDGKADGVTDQRVGISAILYPQPFGLETEWNIGSGPELNQATNTIESKSLFGGYVQANYRLQTPKGEFFPFARWNYYDGGRKFSVNAPHDTVNEVDIGFEWSPWDEIEFALMYTHTFDRTNTRDFPYDTVQGADRIALQVQWNY